MNAAILSLGAILLYTSTFQAFELKAYFNPSLVTALAISNITFIVGSCLKLLDQKWFPEKQKPQKHKEAYLIGSFVAGAVFLLIWLISNIVWHFQS